MYHAQHSQVGFREMNFPAAVLRGTANFFYKISLGYHEARKKEAARLVAEHNLISRR